MTAEGHVQPEHRCLRPLLFLSCLAAGAGAGGSGAGLNPEALEQVPAGAGATPFQPVPSRVSLHPLPCDPGKAIVRLLAFLIRGDLLTSAQPLISWRCKRGHEGTWGCRGGARDGGGASRSRRPNPLWLRVPSCHAWRAGLATPSSAQDDGASRGLFGNYPEFQDQLLGALCHLQRGPVSRGAAGGPERWPCLGGPLCWQLRRRLLRAVFALSE